jgi:hypothetical protein
MPRRNIVRWGGGESGLALEGGGRERTGEFVGKLVEQLGDERGFACGHVVRRGVGCCSGPVGAVQIDSMRHDTHASLMENQNTDSNIT